MLLRIPMSAFYHATACNATRGIAQDLLSVRQSVLPSVCPSVIQTLTRAL